MPLSTLKKRSEFLRLRGGSRWATPAFVLETKRRSEQDDLVAGPRFGFTVTKKLGGAVVRNRIRRRLKAVVAAAQGHARTHYDYVLIARSAAFDRSFTDIEKDLEQALRRVHRDKGARAGQDRRKL